MCFIHDHVQGQSNDSYKNYIRIVYLQMFTHPLRVYERGRIHHIILSKQSGCFNNNKNNIHS